MSARTLLLVLFVAAGALDARAMTVPPISAAELDARSDLIVDGRVVDARARWVGRRVITFYVVEYAAASTTTTATTTATTVVAVPGGAVGTLAQKVPGAPVLEVGARYRLHLGRAEGPRATADGPPSRGIVGFFRGVARLVDGEGGAVTVVPFTDDGQPARSTP